ncbi:MAG: dihydrolipoyl dehydrogenase [Candidatus Omnitrophota bacterium]
MKADVTILGGGPGGIAASLHASHNQFKTILVEKDAVGGVCLHRGCIPTKSLITDALALEEGLSGKEKQAFLEAMLRRKESVVARLHQGALASLRDAGVLVVRGEARIISERCVRVNEENIDTRFILVATGSRPKTIQGFPFDGTEILSSDHLLQEKEAPGSLVIIGAGPSGCEFAGLFHRLGTRVILLEALPFLLPGFDEEISETLKKIFIRQGIGVHTGETVASFQRDDGGVLVAAASGAHYRAEKVLVSVGRTPNTQGLGLEELGVSMNQGFIAVDRQMRTSVPTVFAVGDATGKWPLAHAASHQGRVAVDAMAGKESAAEEFAVPECVFTVPEVAKVGWTEKTARGRGKVSIGRAPFIRSAKAQILGQKEGFVKLVGESPGGKLVGAHLIGPHVTELIGELALACRVGISIRDIQEVPHPHPTLSESVEEAARDFVQRDDTFSGLASKTN